MSKKIDLNLSEEDLNVNPLAKRESVNVPLGIPIDERNDAETYSSSRYLVSSFTKWWYFSGQLGASSLKVRWARVMNRMASVVPQGRLNGSWFVSAYIEDRGIKFRLVGWNLKEDYG